MWRKLRFNISSRAWVMPSAGERVRGDRVIHDSARALVTPDVITRAVAEAQEHGAAIAAARSAAGH